MRIQRLFTRGEQAALKEILLKTRNLRRIPEGAKLTPRDLDRFNKAVLASQEILLPGRLRGASGVLTDKTPGEIKTLLEHANLNLSAKEVDHLISKYTNKRALARLRRIQNKSTDFDFDYQSYLKRKNTFKSRNNETFDRLKRGFNTFTPSGEDVKLLRDLGKEAEDRGIGIVTSKEKMSGSIFNVGRPLNPGLIRYNRDMFVGKVNNKKLRKMVKSLDGKEKIMVIPRTGSPTTGYHELGHDISNSSSIGKDINDARRFIKSGRPYAPSSTDSLVTSLSLSGDKILQARPEVCKTKLGEMAVSWANASDHAVDIADEINASSRALSRLKKHGATPAQLQSARDELTDSAMTYLESPNRMTGLLRGQVQWG